MRFLTLKNVIFSFFSPSSLFFPYQKHKDWSLKAFFFDRWKVVNVVFMCYGPKAVDFIDLCFNLLHHKILKMKWSILVRLLLSRSPSDFCFTAEFVSQKSSAFQNLQHLCTTLTKNRQKESGKQTGNKHWTVF